MKLSACMMVRNNENYIARAVKSIVDLVDEIVVVDTGSTDQTIPIIKEHARGKLKLIDGYQPEDDFHFSNARNLSIESASGDWVFIFDSDDEFHLFDPDENRRYTVEKLKEDIFNLEDKFSFVSIPLVDMFSDSSAMRFNSPRFFRKGRVHYIYRVHNAPQTDGEGAFHAGVHIKHHGMYNISEEEKKKKRDRSQNLLMKRLEDDPEDYACYFYLGQIFHSDEMFDLSIHYGEKYLSHKDDMLSVNFFDSIYYTLAKAYFAKDDYKSMLNTIQRGLAYANDNLDLWFALAEYGNVVGDSLAIRDGSEKFLHLYEKLRKDPSISKNRFTYSFKPDNEIYCLRCLWVQYQLQADSIYKLLLARLPMGTANFTQSIKNQMNVDWEVIMKNKHDMLGNKVKKRSATKGKKGKNRGKSKGKK